MRRRHSSGVFVALAFVLHLSKQRHRHHQQRVGGQKRYPVSPHLYRRLLIRIACVVVRRTGNMMGLDDLFSSQTVLDLFSRGWMMMMSVSLGQVKSRRSMGRIGREEEEEEEEEQEE